MFRKSKKVSRLQIGDKRISYPHSRKICGDVSRQALGI